MIKTGLYVRHEHLLDEPVFGPEHEERILRHMMDKAHRCPICGNDRNELNKKTGQRRCRRASCRYVFTNSFFRKGETQKEGRRALKELDRRKQEATN